MKETAALNSSHELYRYVRAGERVIKSSCQPTKTDMRQQQVRYLAGLELRTTRTSSRVNVSLRVITAKGVRILHWQQGKSADAGIYQSRFSLADRSESIQFELDSGGDVISREVYFPFGGTAIWVTTSQITSHYKTMRYCSKERDISGLLYYGYRYYAPWMMCWINTDPAGVVDGLNLFRMVRNNPATFVDNEGRIPVNKDDMQRMVLATHRWFERAMLLGRQDGNLERNHTILGAVLPIAGFLIGSLSKYIQQQHENDREFRAFGELAHNILPDVDPITDEKYRLRNITVIGTADKNRPAITYTMKGQDRKLVFEAHGNVARGGEPIINGKPLSVEEFHSCMNCHHSKFDSSYDLLMLHICNTPEGAKKYGQALCDKMNKDIVMYSGIYSFREKDSTGLLKEANNKLNAGEFPFMVTEYVRNEEENGRQVFRRKEIDKSKFLFFGSKMTGRKQL